MNQEPTIPSPPPIQSNRQKMVHILTITSLILVPPIGLILMWLLVGWDRGIKIAITAIIILIAISLIGMVWFIITQQSLYRELKELDLQTREIATPGAEEEKILSASEYMREAETELSEVKKYLAEDDVIAVQRHTAKALEYAILATDLEPSNPEIWFRRGDIYWELKDIALGAEEWALKSYKKALELEPENQLYQKKVNELTGVKEVP